MKVMAFNGSPRKKVWNTVTLLQNVLDGAASAGAETEMVHLYDLKFSGCISCFACKRIGRKEDGVCAVNDGLTPVLEKIREADAIVIGTPVYYGAESAATRAFIERLCFPYNKYSKEVPTLFPRRIKTGLIYTMNVDMDMLKTFGYQQHFEITKMALSNYFGPCEMLLSTDTLQYSDYSKFESGKFDGAAKAVRHEKIFPDECRAAFELGISMAS